MPGSVLAKSLRDIRRSFVWWSIGLICVVAMMMAIYPSVRGNESMTKLVNSLPEALKSFTSFGGDFDWASPTGYLGRELFSFMVPLLLLVAAIGGGSGSIAGEEERGTLDLLLSLPVSRTRVALEKLAAMAIEVAGLGLVFLLALWIGARAVTMHVAAVNLAAATLNAVLLALAFGSVAFMLGAAFGRRALATGVASAAAVAAYLLNALAPLVGTLTGVQKASPFYHYAAGDPLRQGLQPAHSLLLLALAVAASLVAVVGFRRRDLR
jgi:ABC-2 type transport system permease protein